MTESDLATVLYASISGYTRLADEPDDEESELEDAFAAVVRDTLGEFGGQPYVFAHGSAACDFGSARQALRAAISLQRDLRTALPVGVGIGLEAEVAALGPGARSGAIDTALRLSLLAGPGRVLATETVVHLGQRVAGIDYGAPKRRRVVGINGRSRVYELTSTEPRPPVPVQAAGHSTRGRRGRHGLGWLLPWRHGSE